MISRIIQVLCFIVVFVPLPAQVGTGNAQKIISNGISVLKSDTLNALRLFHEAAQAARLAGDKKTAAEAFLHCAETEKYLDSSNAVIRSYKESALLYETAGMKAEAAKVYTELGLFQSDLAQFDDALASFRKSDEIATAGNMHTIHAHNLVGSGIVMTKQGDLVNAQQNFTDALELFEAAHDSAGIADAWNGIGIVHWKEGKNREAMDAYRKSLTIRLSENDSLAIASSYSNIGVISRLQGKYEDALNYDLLALGIRQRHHDKRGEAQVRFNIGSLLTDMNRNEEGLAYYNESYAIKLAIGDNYGLLSYYLNTGELYGSLNEPAKQEHALLMGLALADSLQAMDYIKSFSFDLAEYYASHNNYEKAYFFHNRYSTTKDSLLSREKNAELSRLEAEYDLKDKQRNIEKLESDGVQMKEREERDLIFRYGLIAIIVIVLLFTAFVVNRTLVLRKTNVALEASNRLVEKRDQEKEILLREVHHRVKNNLQLTSSLLNLQAREMKDSESTQALKEARDRIKAISLVHEELFTGNEPGSIQLANYIPELCNSVLSSNNPGQNIRLQYDLNNALVPLDTSVSLGLMLNEIIINSIKYAFDPVSPGIISVSCTTREDGLHISVSDNGKGVRPGIISGESSGFGLKLLQSLAVKLGAKLELRSDNGTTVTIFVPPTHQHA